MTYSNQAFASPIEARDALIHHGVKGQKWGVVNQDENALGANTAPSKSVRRKAVAKKVAIGAGVLAVAAGAGYAAYKLNQSGALKLGSLNPSTMKAGESFAKKAIMPNTDIIHLARGKNIGLTFLRKGGTPDYFSIFDKAGMNSEGLAREFFDKLTDGSGNSIARFLDPLGRTDAATRPIAHDVVIPHSMSSGLGSVDDVKEKIWPLVKDTYDAFYQKSLASRY